MRAIGAACALALTSALLAGCGGSSSKTGSTGATSSATASSGTSSTATAPNTNATTTSSTTTPPAAANSRTVKGASGSLSAILRAGPHTPKVNRPWPIRFVVRRDGRLVKASVSYQYLFGGAVVARRSHYTFTGRFADTFRWPSSAVGYPLTFRAVIQSGGATINLDYPVKVSR